MSNRFRLFTSRGILAGWFFSVAALTTGCAGAPAGSENGPTAGALGRVVFDVEPLEGPSEGKNAFRVALEEIATGAPLVGAAITVRPRMPSMGHTALEEPTVIEDGGGIYQVSNVIFSMPGTWEVYFRVSQDSLIDEALFSYDVR
jgi:hypothetical protein